MANLITTTRGRIAEFVSQFNGKDPLSFHEVDKIYIERFRPVGLPERQLVFELASIHYILERILALTFAMEMSQIPFDAKAHASLFRRECSLVRRRLAVIKTLTRLRKQRPHPVRTQISNAGNKIDPQYEPSTNPAGLCTNPNSGSRKPRKRAKRDPVA
jgi:hypothetical protein